MPARPRTSNEAVIAAARDVLEADGPQALTMQAVADRVGVRAPSLYKRFADRPALIAAVAIDAFDELGREIAAAIEGGDAAADLRRIADAYRAFAHRVPRAYGLMFSDLGPSAAATDEARRRSSAPVISLVRGWLGESSALDAARMLTAFVHGFVSMELAGAFRLGGDLDRAWRYGVDTLIAALAEPRTAKG